MLIPTSSQVSQLDAYTIENAPISGLDLMEKASRAFVDQLLIDCDASTYHIFVGFGNNGGDGLAIARLLFCLGKEVFVFTNVSSLSTDESRSNLDKLPKGVVIKSFPDVDSLETETDYVIIDALFGVGLNRPLSTYFSKLIKFINTEDRVVVSVDLPSGLSADLDVFSESIVKATFTYTFGYPKHCFYFKECHKYIGSWSCLDIGLLNEAESILDKKVTLLDQEYIGGLLKKRDKYSHKGLYGHACLCVGSKGMIGAALLSAQACLRSGVGLLTINIPQCGYDIIQASIPEAIVMLDKNDDFLSEFNESIFSSYGIGCGVGSDDNTLRFLKDLIIKSTNKNIVIDADGLNLLSKLKESKKLLNGLILTPHPKEFDRLFGEHKSTIDRYRTQLEVSVKYDCYILLKGAYTHVTTPDGLTFINPTGNPGMATAGSGDVLTGIITGLLAQGYSRLSATLLGVYMHGFAGDVAASKFSQHSLVASDIVDSIPSFWLNFED